MVQELVGPEEIEDEEITAEVEEPDADPVDDPEPEPEDDRAALMARIEALEARDSAINTLTSSVGRIQSMLTKLDSGRGDESAIRQELTDQLGMVNTLTDVLGSMDETFLPPEALAKVRAAQVAVNERMTKAQRDSLKDEIRRELTPEAPEQDQGPQVSPFEQSLLAAIAVAGLQPDDEHFDWQEANKLLSTQGQQAVVGYFRNQIKDALTSDSAADRRQTRKANAGAGAPRPVGNTKTIDDRLHDGSLEDRLAAAREMGILT